VASNDYRFVTRWHFNATAEEVDAILSDGESLARWWPSVYLEVKTLAAGGPDGIGKRVGLLTQGWLPYRLRWEFTVTRADRPRGFAIDANGDFVGTGVWRFEPAGDQLEVTYEWTIRADKALLKYLSFAMKPFFSLNHHWAMERGREALGLELQRRRGIRVPSPRGPVPAWYSLGALAIGCSTLGALVWALARLF
jgi:hypothetical protein